MIHIQSRSLCTPEIRPLLTFCSAVRCTSGSVLLLAVLRRNGSQGVCRTGPSGPAAPARPAARRPWRPSRLRRPVCRGTEQTRSLGFPWCSGLAGCRRPLPGRTSQTPGGGLRERSGTLDCPLWGKSCRRRPAEACRNSCCLAREAREAPRTVRKVTQIAPARLETLRRDRTERFKQNLADVAQFTAAKSTEHATNFSEPRRASSD